MPDKQNRREAAIRRGDPDYAPASTTLGVGLFCPACSRRMQLMRVYRRAAWNDPDRGTYREGIAVCRNPDGSIRHGPYRGHTDNLENPGDPIWLYWDKIRDTSSQGCVCFDENRATCLGGLPA